MSQDYIKIQAFLQCWLQSGLSLRAISRKQEALCFAPNKVFKAEQRRDEAGCCKQKTATDACSGVLTGATPATAPTGNTQRLFFSCFLHEKGHKLRWQSELVLACNCTQLRILQLHTLWPATVTAGLTAIVVLLQMSPNTGNSIRYVVAKTFSVLLLRMWFYFSEKGWQWKYAKCGFYNS